jgi:hypothetical protein
VTGSTLVQLAMNATDANAMMILRNIKTLQCERRAPDPGGTSYRQPERAMNGSS